MATNMTTVTTLDKFDSWLEETAKALGFSSTVTLTVSIVILFMSLLAMGLAIVLFCTLVVKRILFVKNRQSSSVFVLGQGIGWNQGKMTSQLPRYECMDTNEGLMYWWDEQDSSGSILKSAPLAKLPNLDYAQTFLL